MLHIPIPIKNEEGGIPLIPGMLIIDDDTTGNMLLSLATQDYPDDTQKLLSEFANHLLDLGSTPKQITVSDDKTFNLIEDFCRKCDIKLKKVKSLPQLDEDCMMMLQEIMLGIM